MLGVGVLGVGAQRFDVNSGAAAAQGRATRATGPFLQMHEPCDACAKQIDPEPLWPGNCCAGGCVWEGSEGSVREGRAGPK